MKETKYLGVKLDENLMWIPQVNSVVSKVSKYVPIIYNLRNHLNNMSLRLLYNSLVYPNIVYCNSVWGAANASTLRPLVLMQKKILQAMSYKSRCEPSAPLLRSFNFLNAYNINLYMCGFFTFKVLIAESEWFTTYRPNEYNTRLSNMSTLFFQT